MSVHNETLAGEKAWEVLGVSPGADETELRKAYLAKLRLHPPDRDPEMFEIIRDAYNVARRPEVRVEKLMAAGSVRTSLASLLDDVPDERAHVGCTPWLAVLKESQ